MTKATCLDRPSIPASPMRFTSSDNDGELDMSNKSQNGVNCVYCVNGLSRKNSIIQTYLQKQPTLDRPSIPASPVRFTSSDNDGELDMSNAMGGRVFSPGLRQSWMFPQGQERPEIAPDQKNRHAPYLLHQTINSKKSF